MAFLSGFCPYCHTLIDFEVDRGDHGKRFQCNCGEALEIYYETIGRDTYIGIKKYLRSGEILIDTPNILLTKVVEKAMREVGNGWFHCYLCTSINTHDDDCPIPDIQKYLEEKSAGYMTINFP